MKIDFSFLLSQFLILVWAISAFQSFSFSAFVLRSALRLALRALPGSVKISLEFSARIMNTIDTHFGRLNKKFPWFDQTKNPFPGATLEKREPGPVKTRLLLVQWANYLAVVVGATTVVAVACATGGVVEPLRVRPLRLLLFGV